MARNAPLKSEPKNEKPSAASIADDVDKIRDIIFGGQMREYAARFDALEQMIDAKFERLAADIEQRFEQLAQRLGAESAARETVARIASEELRDAEKEITKSLANAEERWAGEASELRGALGEGHEELASIIENVKQELGASLAAEAGDLERRKLAIDDLAQLFADVARNLKKQAK